jgi:hypothetical protein
MPAFEVMFKELIHQMRDEEKLAQLQELIAEGKGLVEILGEMGLIANDGQRVFIGRTPDAIQAAILAAVGQNLQRDSPKQMLFTWTPGYDWELRLTESTSTDISAGGITVHVKSRYPGDAHPGTGV